MTWRILRIFGVIAFLVLGTISFVGYLGNSFSYSDWYGLSDKKEMMVHALREAYLYFSMFITFELAALATTFSLVKWKDSELPAPLRWLGRALVSLGVVVVAFVVNMEAFFLYGRYVRHH
jgi:formate hydrogenlyase subunit 4